MPGNFSWMDEGYRKLFPTSKGVWSTPTKITDPLQRTGQGGLTFAKSPAKLLRGGVSSGASGASGVAAAGRTASQVAKAAGLWSIGFNFASKLFDKSKKGQPAPQTGVGKEQLTSGITDWNQFFA